MIIPTIYSQNEQQIANDLLPVRRRKPKFLGWIGSVMNPIQWLHDLVFIDYYAGSSVAPWNPSILYLYQNRVVYYDGCIYELQRASLISSAPPPQDSANWLKILDNWIGVAERVKYSGQKIMLEYALNKYFSLFDPTISPSLPYIGANGTTDIFIAELTGIKGEFWLTNAGNQLTSFMSKQAGPGTSQQYFLGNAYGRYVFSINVPTSTDALIAAQQAPGITAESVVRAFADKYVQAGNLYKYLTY